MKFIQKTFAIVLATALLCGALLHVSALETPMIPIPPAEEGVYISPFYYELDEANGIAVVTGFGGWQTEITIPETVEYEGKTYTVTTIGEDAFTAENTLTAITLTLAIKSVEDGAFKGCTKLADVWYEGTKAQKAQISIGANNADLTDAAWHYEACILNPASEKVHGFDNACDAACNYCSYERTVSDHAYDDENDVFCNVCGYLRMIPGDLDENDVVDMDDAIYFLYHYHFPEFYELNPNHNLDYDKSGEVDLDDVFYLLYHVNFPEQYPVEITQ